MTTTTSATATRSENIRLIRKIFDDGLKPADLTDDELVATLELLKIALDRKRERLRARVVDLDLVRSGKRRRGRLEG